MPAPSKDPTIFRHAVERFETRARALFYARLALMSIGLAALAVPAWHRALNIPVPFGVYAYLVILGYQVASYLWVGRRHARAVIFGSLCLDLLVFLSLLAMSGGIKSPLMPTQLVFTMLFALLYPSPLAIIPPLLTLPVVAKLDQILGTQTLPGDLLLLLWFSALNITVVYVMVYLEGRERSAFQQVVELQHHHRESALTGERTRIAREIHDSVGAALSGVLLQAEYLLPRAETPELRAELEELRETAAQGIDELRRAVSVMRHEFDLTASAADYVEAFGQRHHVAARFESEGLEPDLEPEVQLVLFRVLQEALANVARHAAAKGVEVRFRFSEGLAGLRVSDDGKGFDPASVVAGHYGLRNMSERAARLGGTLRITSEPGQGTRLEVEVPLAHVVAQPG
jgi:two-component system, NarL family, sensor histidine kinase DegS